MPGDGVEARGGLVGGGGVDDARWPAARRVPGCGLSSKIARSKWRGLPAIARTVIAVSVHAQRARRAEREQECVERQRAQRVERGHAAWRQHGRDEGEDVAGPREDQERPLRVRYGLTLGRCKVGQQFVRGRHCVVRRQSGDLCSR